MNKSAVMKDKKGEHPFGDAGQAILFLVFLLVWITDSFILKKTTFLAEYIPFYIRLLVFVILFITALLLFKKCRFIIAGEERPNYVVNTGIYKYIRHPMYLASILLFLSFSVLTVSIASAVVLIIGSFFYSYIAKYEEKILLNKFGKAYSNYMNKTGRWLPRL